MNITRKRIMRKQNIVVTQSAFHMFKDPQTPYANSLQKKELTLFSREEKHYDSFCSMGNPRNLIEERMYATGYHV